MEPVFGLMFLAASLSSLLGRELRCSPNEYPLSNTKCCKYCVPGEQLAKRCTAASDTACEPCEENYYNDDYSYSECKPCTDCDPERGLWEIRPCQRFSNAICACLPGHSPVETGVDKRCKACPGGYFSPGGNERCRPWKNCTATGRKTLHRGKQDADTVCDEPPSEVPTLVTQPSSVKTGAGVLATEPNSPKVLAKNPGLAWLLAILLLLLTIAGASILLFFHRRTKKKTVQISCEDIFAAPCEDEGSGYRMPIQEQQTGGKSSFVQG